MGYINEEGIKALWKQTKARFMPYVGDGISKQIPSGEQLWFAMDAPSVSGAVFGMDSNRVFFKGRTNEDIAANDDSMLSWTFANKQPRMEMTKEHATADTTSDDALEMTLTNQGVAFASNDGATVSASMGVDGISLNDYNGHTVAIRVNGEQIPQAVEISGSGNAVTDVSFSNGRLTFAKGTISGGEGADGNSYPTSVDLTYSNGNVGVSLASTNGMATISDTVAIDDTLRLNYTLKSNEDTARLQFDFGHDEDEGIEKYSFKVDSKGITLTDNTTTASLVMPFGETGTLVVDTALTKEEIEAICV